MKSSNPIIQNLTFKTVIRPLRTAFTTSRGTKNHIRSIIVKVTCSNGSVGIGEIPTSFLLPRETTDAIKKILTAIKPDLIEKPVADWSLLTASHRKQFPDFPMTSSGLEVAMFRAYLAAGNKCEHTWWGGKEHSVTTDITIPLTSDVNTLLPWLKRAVRAGFVLYKVKVSGCHETDVDFVRSIWAFLSDTACPCPLRLDGNQAFTPDSAMRLLDCLASLSIPVELFEQPLKSHEHKGAAQLYKKIPVPLIADESVFTEADCRRVIDDQLAHGVNIKIAKSGITESRKIISAARSAKLKLMLGCMTETMIGLSAGIYTAAGIGAFDYIDLDSIHFLNPDKQTWDVTVHGPQYCIGETQ